MDTRAPVEMPPALVPIALLGGAVALLGGYWDDAWHTERGRDSFLIAPHVAIYGGVATAGGALALWGLLAVRRGGARAAFRHAPLALGLLGVAVTLASGPVDNLWHAAFGRDAVIWSPPHILGIAGTFALGVALMTELDSRGERWAARASVAAGALALAAAGFTVVEYDTDVPQFDAAYYLPVLGLAAALALTLIRLSGGRWAATRAAVAYIAFIAAVGGFLELAGFPPPALPLVVLAAAIVDLSAARGWRPLASAAAFTLALHAAYLPARNLIGDGVRFDGGDLAVSLPLTFAAVAAVFALAAAGVTRERRRWHEAVVASILGLLALAPAALAHDPGQGEAAGSVAMTVAVRGERADLVVRPAGARCGSTEPVAAVARRAGVTERGPLRRRGCELRGHVAVPERGRWFVYAEMRREGRRVETWLPVVVRDSATRVADEDRYAYHPPDVSGAAVKAIAGVVLYGGMLALVVATFVLTARTGAGRRAR
jgi:hypothetical protein